MKVKLLAGVAIFLFVAGCNVGVLFAHNAYVTASCTGLGIRWDNYFEQHQLIVTIDGEVRAINVAGDGGKDYFWDDSKPHEWSVYSTYHGRNIGEGTQEPCQSTTTTTPTATTTPPATPSSSSTAPPTVPPTSPPPSPPSSELSAPSTSQPSSTVSSTTTRPPVTTSSPESTSPSISPTPGMTSSMRSRSCSSPEVAMPSSTLPSSTDSCSTPHNESRERGSLPATGPDTITGWITAAAIVCFGAGVLLCIKHARWPR